MLQIIIYVVGKFFFFLSGFMIVMNNYSWKEQAWFTFFFNIDYLGRIVENAFFFYVDGSVIWAFVNWKQ